MPMPIRRASSALDGAKAGLQKKLSPAPRSTGPALELEEAPESAGDLYEADDEPDLTPEDDEAAVDEAPPIAPGPEVALSLSLTPAPARQGVLRCNIFEAFQANGGTAIITTVVPEQRLNKEPAELVFFSLDSEVALLHIEKEESNKTEGNRGFFRCPGEGCPYCEFGQPPTKTWLMPVLAVAEGSVRVVRVTAPPAGRQNARALMPQLAALGASGKLGTSIVSISREGAQYTVEAEPVDVAVVSDLLAIKEFKAAYDAGKIFLADTFNAPSADDLAQLPWVRRKKDASRLRAGKGA